MADQKQLADEAVHLLDQKLAVLLLVRKLVVLLDQYHSDCLIVVACLSHHIYLLMQGPRKKL